MKLKDITVQIQLTYVAYALACKRLQQLTGKPAAEWSKQLVVDADEVMSNDEDLGGFEQMIADALNFGEKVPD